jgi:hypothetical protein
VSESREYIKQHKTGKPCFDCGKVYPWYVMDYDHLEGKRFNIGSARKTVPLDIVKKEIKKCQVVCANCHRERTYQRQQKKKKPS